MKSKELRFLILACSAFVVSCAPLPTPTLTTVPTSTRIALDAPTATEWSTATATPTEIAMATSTNVPTETATATSTATNTAIATRTPTNTPLPTRTATPRPLGLRDLAARIKVSGQPFEIGLGGFPAWPAYTVRNTLISEQFNVIDPGWMMDFMREKGPNYFQFDLTDQWVRFAEKYDMQVRGTLVWGVEQFFPEWLKNGSFSRDQLIAIMQNHIQTLMAHYKGQVREWSVVNEAVWAYKGHSGYSDTLWFRIIGPEYIELAFKTARESDPSAILIYNDYGAEFQGLKADAVYDLVKGLRVKGLVDAVGMQMHFIDKGDGLNPDPLHPPTKAEIVAQMQRYGNLGVRVYVTELDVDTKRLPGTPAEKLLVQAAIYKTVIEACLESKVCDGVSVWGVNDEESWLLDRGGETPLLFARNIPKPAYFAVRDVLLEYAQKQK